MKRIFRGPVLLTLVLLPSLGQGQASYEEKAEVEQQLQTKKAALALLQSQKVGVLEVMDLFGRLSAATARRVYQSERRVNGLRRRLQLAEAQNALAQAAFLERAAKMSPRLVSLYRLFRHAPGGFLASSASLTASMREKRDLNLIVQSDLAGLEDVSMLAQFQRRSQQELEAMSATLTAELTWQKAQSARLKSQQRDLADLLELVRAEASRSKRLVHELENADRDLTRVLTEQARAPVSSGFGALYGRLPMPVAGTIEVGFGKVVNPRFHTTTVQKGLDIRAPEGASVRAIAKARVVYAGWLLGYGNLLILDHGDGYHSLVSHLGGISRAVGDEVLPNEELGMVGDTGSLKGPYLYFELRHKGVAVDPVPWLGRGRAGQNALE